MVALNPNQFTQTPVQGQVDLMYGPTNVVGAIISTNIPANGTVAGGYAVKLDSAIAAIGTGSVPKVLPITANTDPIFGFIPFNIKDVSRGSGQTVEVARNETYMYMTSSAAIAAGANVEYDFATQTVKTAAGINPSCGVAYDAAAATGQLIRVEINPRTVSGATENVAQFTATLAQINAGLVLIPGVAGKKINVTNYTARVAGAFTGGTNVLLESTNATPVVVSTIAEAGLTNGAVLTPASANTTLGAGFAAPLGSGDGLQVASTGTQSGGTSITFTISYSQV